MTDVERAVIDPRGERQIIDEGRVREEVRRVGDTVLTYHNNLPSSDPTVYDTLGEAKAAYAIAVMGMLDTTRDAWVAREFDEVGGLVMQTMHATMMEVRACREGHPVPALADRARVAYDLLFGHVTLAPDELWHMCQKIATGIAEVRL